MSKKQADAVFHGGLVSPSPWEDALYADSTTLTMPGEGLDETQEDQLDDHVFGSIRDWTNMPGISTDLSSMSGTRYLPPTPNSDSHVAGMSSGDGISLDNGSRRVRPRMGEPPRKDSESSSNLEEAIGSGVAARTEQSVCKKQCRRESIISSSNEEQSEFGGLVQVKDRSREKNKIAAAKCRAKKRDNMEMIESSHRTLSTENSLLKRQEQQLRARVSELRTLALDHQSCSCGVHQYNMLEARKLAHGLGGLCSSMSNEHTSDCRQPEPEVHPDSSEMWQQDAQSFHTPSHFDVISEDFLSMHASAFQPQQNFFDFDPNITGNHDLDA